MVKILSHYVPRSLALQVALELLILVASVYFGVRLNVEYGVSPETVTSDAALLKISLVSSIIFFALIASGRYWYLQRSSFLGSLSRVFAGFLLAILALIMLSYALHLFEFPLDALVNALQFGLFGILFAHSIHYLLYKRGATTTRVIVFGDGEAARPLLQNQLSGVDVVGYVPTPGESTGEFAGSFLRTDLSLFALCKELKVGEIVVANNNLREVAPMAQLLECKLEGIRVVDASTFAERRLRKIGLNTLSLDKIILSEGYRITLMKRLLKRTLDIAATLLLLVPISPVMALAAFAILVESGGKGPILYRQVRVGQRGRLFHVIKFRSMRTDAEVGGAPQYAEKDDPRVTNVGRVLRKLRIDELPQFLNVLRGEMSFVGPRPERPEFVEKYLANVPYYGLRHEVRPGITGWAQISYPYGASEQDTVEKLQYDLYYVKHFGLLTDINILFQTVHIVLFGTGAR